VTGELGGHHAGMVLQVGPIAMATAAQLNELCRQLGFVVETLRIRPAVTAGAKELVVYDNIAQNLAKFAEASESPQDLLKEAKSTLTLAQEMKRLSDKAGAYRRRLTRFAKIGIGFVTTGAVLQLLGSINN